MLGSFRLIMTWLHTWFGLLLGYVLMAVFFFGSLTVFCAEIDRWTMPDTRFESPPMPSFDKILRPALERLQPEAEALAEAREQFGEVHLPLAPLYWSTDWSTRHPVVGFYAEFDVNPEAKGDYVEAHTAVDPRTGELWSRKGFPIGSDFFYPLHFSLTLYWQDLGIWIVGLSSLVMLIALVSGVVIHKKIFREFFTFRPLKKGQRRVLDLHNLTGVVAAPFHFAFAVTGLVIFAGMYFPVHETVLTKLREHHQTKAHEATSVPHERAGVPAPLASVDAMITEAKRHWANTGKPSEVGGIQIMHPFDANGHVTIYPAVSSSIALDERELVFEAPTGRLLRAEQASSTIDKVNRYLVGLHLMPFAHWGLRWLFFIGGLVGCVCIATGFVFFVGKRRDKHAAHGIRGARWVDALAITSVTGMLIATLAIMVSNRLLPEEGEHAAVWQERVFWCAWLLAFVHAACRTAPVRSGKLAPAWREQCHAIVLLALSAVILNWVTTGDHLLRTLSEGYWPVASVDLMLLLGALAAGFAAWRLRHAELVGKGSRATKAEPNRLAELNQPADLNPLEAVDG